MLGSLLRRLTGQKAEAPARHGFAPASPALSPAADPVETEVASAVTPSSPPVGNGDLPGPVFSSRAVRDATVVTGAIESLTRFSAGQEVIDELIHRLDALTPDQVNFLQLSAEPGLVQRTLLRAEGLKGTKASALRKLLGDIAGGAIPETGKANPLLVPKGPILPPLASLQPRPAVKPAEPSGPGSAATTSFGPAAGPVPGAAAGVTVAAMAPPAAAMAPVTAPAQQAPSGPLPSGPPSGFLSSAPLPPGPLRPRMPAAASPAPVATPVSPASAPAEPAVAAVPPPPEPVAPPPAPAPKPDELPAGLPRMARADAEDRRARLMAALTDHLSSSEAAP